jgi:hypothetical protein
LASNIPYPDVVLLIAHFDGDAGSIW